MSAPSLLFVLTFAFVCYVLGATFVEALVNYRQAGFARLKPPVVPNRGKNEKSHAH